MDKNLAINRVHSCESFQALSDERKTHLRKQMKKLNDALQSIASSHLTFKQEIESAQSRLSESCGEADNPPDVGAAYESMSITMAELLLLCNKLEQNQMRILNGFLSIVTSTIDQEFCTKTGRLKSAIKHWQESQDQP